MPSAISLAVIIGSCAVYVYSAWRLVQAGKQVEQTVLALDAARKSADEMLLHTLADVERRVSALEDRLTTIKRGADGRA